MPTDRLARILIVDDEPAVRSILKRALEEAGYEVVAMNDGQAGLTAAVTADPTYDLVVTNNCMPHLSGAEMVAELRKRFPGQPILHLDDLSTPRGPVLPQDVPNLYKPFSIDRLLEAVQELLPGRKQAS